MLRAPRVYKWKPKRRRAAKKVEKASLSSSRHVQKDVIARDYRSLHWMLYANAIDSLEVGSHARPLQRFCLTDHQNEAIELVGRDVAYEKNFLRKYRIAGDQLRYINAFLNQSQGQPLMRPCQRCRDMNIIRWILLSTRLPKFWTRCCENCKWPDKAGLARYRPPLAPLRYDLTNLVWAGRLIPGPK